MVGRGLWAGFNLFGEIKVALPHVYQLHTPTSTGATEQTPNAGLLMAQPGWLSTHCGQGPVLGPRDITGNEADRSPWPQGAHLLAAETDSKSPVKTQNMSGGKK